MHGRHACVHDQGPARARVGVPGKACCERPPWVLYRDREFPIAIEMAHPVSRQVVGQQGLLCRSTILVSRQGAALWVGFVSRHDPWCRDSGASV